MGGASEFCGTTSFLEYLEHKNELGVSSRAKTGDNLQLETDQEEFFCCVISVSGSAGVKMPSENKDGRCWWKLSCIVSGWMVLRFFSLYSGNARSRQLSSQVPLPTTLYREGEKSYQHCNSTMPMAVIEPGPPAQQARALSITPLPPG